jgi:transcriptional regulator with XRE-family HTH domain
LVRKLRSDRAVSEASSPDAAVPPAVEGAAARIREIRRSRGMTQDELARRVGVSRSAIAQWETDRTGQVRANLARVAAVLGVSIGYLLTGDSDTGLVNVETADERALLSLYRQIREPGRAELLRNARLMAAIQRPSSTVTD